MSTTRTLAALIPLFALAGTAVAQDEVRPSAEVLESEGAASDTREVRYKERTEIEFDGVGVNGELARPQGTLLGEARRGTFNPLIRLRLDFEPEIVRSVDATK